MLERGDQRAHRRLRRHARHRVDRRVDGVGAGVRASEHRRDAGAGGVVRVHVDGQVGELLAQRGDERGGGGGLEQPGHVLDREHVDVAVDELAREIEVVVECELGFRRVGDVARVADRRLDDAARRADRVDAELEVVDVVERVEDAEDVHAVLHLPN